MSTIQIPPPRITSELLLTMIEASVYGIHSIQAAHMQQMSMFIAPANCACDIGNFFSVYNDTLRLVRTANEETPSDEQNEIMSDCAHRIYRMIGADVRESNDMFTGGMPGSSNPELIYSAQWEASGIQWTSHNGTKVKIIIAPEDRK